MMYKLTKAFPDDSLVSFTILMPYFIKPDFLNILGLIVVKNGIKQGVL